MSIIILLCLTASALAGSICPPRENIYPCSCISQKLKRNNYFTSVTCHHLKGTEDLNAIFPALKKMEIDQFNLYDSFWDANNRKDVNKQVLPSDWMTLLRIKEIEIVDTTLSSCFACSSKFTCKNTFTRRFSAVNSSSDDKICTLCNSSTNDRKFSWTGCMTNLQHFHFQHGKLTAVRADLFPLQMKELREVTLSHNHITKIEKKAFLSTPKLTVLNLSHNVLQNLSSTEFKTLSDLKILDISSNLIKTLEGDLFSNMPNLKEFHAKRNLIMYLKENEWKHIGEKLRFIDVRENPLHCDCDVGWIKGTISPKITMKGNCASPTKFQNKDIRSVSRLILNYTCDEEGRIIKKPSNNKMTTVLTRSPLLFH